MQELKKGLENTQSFFLNGCRGGFMADRRAQLIANLEKNADHSVAFFQSLNPDALEMQVYQEGASWTVKQVLVHPQDTEKMNFLRHIELRPTDTYD